MFYVSVDVCFTETFCLGGRTFTQKWVYRMGGIRGILRNFMSDLGKTPPYETEMFGLGSTEEKVGA